MADNSIVYIRKIAEKNRFDNCTYLFKVGRKYFIDYSSPELFIGSVKTKLTKRHVYGALIVGTKQIFCNYRLYFKNEYCRSKSTSIVVIGDELDLMNFLSEV